MEHTDLLISVGGIATWSRFVSVDNDTYSIPIYVCKVLDGKHKGETIATNRYFDMRGRKFNNPLEYQYQF